MYLPSAFPQAAALEAELLMPQPQPLYISLLKNTKLLRQPNLSFFSMLLADKRFKYVMVLFLLEIGDNVKKHNFLHGSGRGSGERGSPVSGEHCEIWAAFPHESFTLPAVGLKCLKAVGTQISHINIAHVKECEIILWDSTSEFFYSISNITCSICVWFKWRTVILLFLYNTPSGLRTLFCIPLALAAPCWP